MTKFDEYKSIAMTALGYEKTTKKQQLEYLVSHNLNLLACNFDYQILKQVDCAGGDFSHSSFRYADLSRANFNGADVSFVDFRGAKLAGATFEGANTTGALFPSDFDGSDPANLDVMQMKGAA